MKIECSCGAKYAFELRDEMRERPVRFVCPACGLDSSVFVDGLVRQQFGQTSAPEGEPVPVLSSDMTRQSPPVVGLRKVQASDAWPHKAASDPDSSPEQQEQQFPVCSKHPGQVAAEKCFICSKPICPKCMELFGYVCSPLCKAKAGSHGIKLPTYEGQRSVMEARRWRKVAWISSAGGAVLIGILALWFWYSWFGSAPKVVFSVRFNEPAYSGQSVFAGTAKDQIVFLHGGTLARYDLKSGKKIWSREVLPHDQIERSVERQLSARKTIVDKATSEAWEHIPRMLSREELIESMERQAAAALTLHGHGQNVWVASPEKLARYQWETGEVVKELAIQTGLGEPIYRGDELLVVNTEEGKPVLTRIDLASGEAHTEALAEAEANLIATNKPGAPREMAAAHAAKGGQMSGLPTPLAGPESGKPIDPAKAASQAQRMSYAEKTALPATLAVNINQQRALKELDEQSNDSKPSQTSIQPGSNFSLIPTSNGFLEFSVRLLEARVATRSAMKAGTGKSALDGDVTAGKSMELATDMLNEMQRSNGGDLVEEDHSRYQVTVRRPGIEAVWSGEVIGPAKIYPLETVAVLASEKQIIVLDKANKKLWQSTLAYSLPADINALDEESATYGRGPCVEHNGSLYVFDEGVLSAFELASGNARWRLPSVGIAGLFFDNRDVLYVNTTTASHENLKYSRQIDLSRKVATVILKVDSRNGKILWTEPSRGLVNYVSGKFILTAASFMPEEPAPGDPETERRPWMRIRRLSPSDGREVWEHFQERAPLDLAFDKNSIRLVFKKEVQVLRFPGL